MSRRRRRRNPTKHQAIARAFGECSEALTRAYRHPEVLPADLRNIVAAVVALHCDGGQRLVLKVESY